MKVLYLDLDNDCAAVEPIADYKLSHFYAHGQSITINYIGYTVINEFIYGRIYHVILTRKLNGDMVNRMRNKDNINARV